MKKYIGTKEVLAEPMTYGDANKAGLIRQYMEGQDDWLGYHVQYEDGYNSWSPEEAFAAYRIAETHVDRIRIELSDLYKRIEKLTAFVKSVKFLDLPDNKKALLQAQLSIMLQYGTILTNRNGVECGHEVTPVFSFGVAIEFLKAGFMVRRKGWNGRGLSVVKQIPAHITSEIVPKMQSLPESAKKKILATNGFIDYTSQCLIYNELTGRADSWVPSISDVFAEDWELA